jgi:hypothetical protein
MSSKLQQQYLTRLNIIIYHEIYLNHTYTLLSYLFSITITDAFATFNFLVSLIIYINFNDFLINIKIEKV